MSAVLILCSSLPSNRDEVFVLSVDPRDHRPLDEVFTGTWSRALVERNRRAEAWSEIADEVRAEPMPVTSFDPRTR